MPGRCSLPRGSIVRPGTGGSCGGGGGLTARAATATPPASRPTAAIATSHQGISGPGGTGVGYALILTVATVAVRGTVVAGIVGVTGGVIEFPDRKVPGGRRRAAGPLGGQDDGIGAGPCIDVDRVPFR